MSAISIISAERISILQLRQRYSRCATLNKSNESHGMDAVSLFPALSWEIVGALVGFFVGIPVGLAEGNDEVGESDVAFMGALLGCSVGTAEGNALGWRIEGNDVVGESDGAFVGALLGCSVGAALGAAEGNALGWRVVGEAVGDSVSMQTFSELQKFVSQSE